MCRLATFDSPLPPPPSSTTCCAPCVLLAGLFFDSYRFAAPHDAARRRWRFILPGSCNSFPKICMRKRGAEAEGGGEEKGRRNGGRKPSGIITLATRCQACLPMPRLLLPAAAAAAACHIQHICNMYELCGISLQLALISFFSAS